ncbi:usg protein [Acetobacter sp.]|uniref:usg protein n=1 Tax=Acetobacter sp. TaxID=440 RepID=UPI0039E9445F
MSIARQLRDYRLTTAEILYRMPDHQALLQSYIWQEYDIPPDFPELKRFLAFWHKKLDGPIHSVRVVHIPLITVPTTGMIGTEFTLH